MPVVSCPFPRCSYATEDIDKTLASTLLQIHVSGAHNSSLINWARTLIQNSATSAINQQTELRCLIIQTGCHFAVRKESWLKLISMKFKF